MERNNNCESDIQFESTHPYANKIPNHYLESAPDVLRSKIQKNLAQLGSDVFILAHHYQKDEVVEFANVIGDSLYLSQQAAQNKVAKHIVFCGVHFMAETAAMLTEDWQHVYLPDENAGCYMADMASRDQVEVAWQKLTELYGPEILPITYVNSTAAVKAFVGEHGGTCVTSTNAERIFKWALASSKRILFLPDQHLGRNTGHAVGIEQNEMAVWNRKRNELDFSADPSQARIILWDGYCSVHQQFTLSDIQRIQETHPETQVIVHPECQFEVVQAANAHGSTNKLLQIVRDAAEGSSFAIGTDNNLVSRIKREVASSKSVHYLNAFSCPCVTMNRIRLPHLAWNLDNILGKNQIQEITVDPKTTDFALKSLNRMLELS
jgi:quinolinate synthase